MSAELNLQNLQALLPIILTSATSVVVMLVIACRRNHFVNASCAVLGLNAALLSVVWVWRFMVLPQAVTGLLVIDSAACFYMALILVSALACVTLAYGYMETHEGNREELYLLLMLSAVGGMVMVCSRHFAALFIGMEILTVPLFGLLAYSFRRARSLEAGMKYLVLSALSTACMLFGMALLYAQTGSLSYTAVAAQLQGDISVLAWAGCAMVLVAFAFKLSFVPFHLWTPDVYEGAPAPVAAYLATASKVAVFAAFVRLLESMPLMSAGGMRDALAAVAALSMVAGSLLALSQNNVKRLLGYSSIANFGYLLIAVVAGLKLEQPTVAIFLLTYVIASLAAFGVLTLLSSPYQGVDADQLHNYRGLFWKRPYLAAVLTVAMLSMAGIPMTAGFIGKFHVIWIGLGAELWWLLAALVLSSALALYYCLRVMVTLYLVSPGMRRFDAPLNWGRTTGGLVVLLAAVLTLLVGSYPEPVLRVVFTAMMAII